MRTGSDPIYRDAIIFAYAKASSFSHTRLHRSIFAEYHLSLSYRVGGKFTNNHPNPSLRSAPVPSLSDPSVHVRAAERGRESKSNPAPRTPTLSPSSCLPPLSVAQTPSPSLPASPSPAKTSQSPPPSHSVVIEIKLTALPRPPSLPPPLFLRLSLSPNLLLPPFRLSPSPAETFQSLLPPIPWWSKSYRRPSRARSLPFLLCSSSSLRRPVSFSLPSDVPISGENVPFSSSLPFRRDRNQTDGPPATTLSPSSLPPPLSVAQSPSPSLPAVPIPGENVSVSFSLPFRGGRNHTDAPPAPALSPFSSVPHPLSVAQSLSLPSDVPISGGNVPVSFLLPFRRVGNQTDASRGSRWQQQQKHAEGQFSALKVTFCISVCHS